MTYVPVGFGAPGVRGVFLRSVTQTAPQMSDILEDKNRVTPIRDDEAGGALSAGSLEESRFATHRFFSLIVVTAGAIDAAGCIRNDL